MTTGDVAGSQNLEELFNCTICFNSYDTQVRKPILLPCKLKERN